MLTSWWGEEHTVDPETGIHTFRDQPFRRVLVIEVLPPLGVGIGLLVFGSLKHWDLLIFAGLTFLILASVTAATTLQLRVEVNADGLRAYQWARVEQAEASEVACICLGQRVAVRGWSFGGEFIDRRKAWIPYVILNDGRRFWIRAIDCGTIGTSPDPAKVALVDQVGEILRVPRILQS